MMEELPNKLEREMKRIEQKDSEVVRMNSAQLSMTTEQVNVLKDNLVYQLESLNDKFI